MDPAAGRDGRVIDIRGHGTQGRPASTDELLVLVARGDRDAFAAFHDQVVDRVFGIVRSVLRDPAMSEEVTQEIMLELWRTAPRYERSLGPASTWACTIAHRRAVDKVRAEEASRRRDTRHARENPVGPAVDVASVVERRFEQRRVRAALAELTDSQRESIELAYFGGHSHSEVAALLGLPLGTVKTRIRDGLIRLRDRLDVVR